MNDLLEDKTKDCFLCNGLTLFGSTLKDGFVLAVKDNYWYLHGLLDPTASISGYNNQKRRSQRLREYCKEPRTLRLTRYDLRQAKTLNKTLRSRHYSNLTSYTLGVSLIILIMNTRYTPKHQDSLSFRPRQSNITGYLSKTLGYSSSGISKKEKKFWSINQIW